jgi:hypothetical protein
VACDHDGVVGLDALTRAIKREALQRSISQDVLLKAGFYVPVPTNVRGLGLADDKLVQPRLVLSCLVLPCPPLQTAVCIPSQPLLY